MYSPFVDMKGKPLAINRVQFKHLTQLKDCDEGHHVEYKERLEDAGKNQLAKEIASFANCEGGWLIVGITDSKEYAPIDKFDYSQKVGKIATRISPMPEFETRFLSMPDNPKKGILLIYVYEGKYAPYICNGSIYVRSGSSKEPIKAADRGNVEYLAERSRFYKQELEEFFVREYFFPYDNLLHKEITYPITTIYLKNTRHAIDYYLSDANNRNKFVEYVLGIMPVFGSVQYSMNSIIFRHGSVLPSTNSITCVMEFFYDWSCKIYVPLAVSDYEEANAVRQWFEEMAIDQEDINKFRLVSGGNTCNVIFAFMKVFERVAQKFHLKEKDFVLGFEVENAAENMLVFQSEKYASYIKKYGIPYAQKTKNRSKTIFLREQPKVKFRDIPVSLVRDFLCTSFGFRSTDVVDIWLQYSEKYAKDE